MNLRKVILLAALALGIGAFFAFDLGRFLTLDYLKSSQAAFSDLYANRPFTVAGVYFLVYVATTALSLPGATIITLAGGAIFGLLWGTVIVSFASSLGATLAFLMSRFVLRSSIENKFGNRLAEINQGMAKDGAFYLFTLRLIPVVPFFVINLVMGLTTMKARTFYGVSQIGML
ncbi:MAG: VTT domain-containing protein, partial [Burkholderiaceae bacterium]